MHHAPKGEGEGALRKGRLRCGAEVRRGGAQRKERPRCGAEGRMRSGRKMRRGAEWEAAVRGGRKDPLGQGVRSGSHAPHAPPLAPTYARAGNTRRLPVLTTAAKAACGCIACSQGCRAPPQEPDDRLAGKAGIANALSVLLMTSDSSVRFACCPALGYSYSSCPVRGRTRVSRRRSLVARPGAARGHARRPTPL